MSWEAEREGCRRLRKNCSFTTCLVDSPPALNELSDGFLHLAMASVTALASSLDHLLQVLVCQRAAVHNLGSSKRAVRVELLEISWCKRRRPRRRYRRRHRRRSWSC
eukprot:763521-Hanusia_phi.AAC.9